MINQNYISVCGPDDILPPSLTWVILFDAVVENGDGDASPREPLAPRPLHVHVVTAIPVKVCCTRNFTNLIHAGLI